MTESPTRQKESGYALRQLAGNIELPNAYAFQVSFTNRAASTFHVDQRNNLRVRVRAKGKELRPLH